MEGFRDIFQAIEGTDENGEVKAISCLLIEKEFEDMESAPEIQKLIFLSGKSSGLSLGENSEADGQDNVTVIFSLISEFLLPVAFYVCYHLRVGTRFACSFMLHRNEKREV